MEKFRITIVQRLVPHYRIELFRLLNEKFFEREVEFDLIFSLTPSDFRPHGLDLNDSFATRAKSLWLKIGRKNLTLQFFDFGKLMKSRVVVIEHSFVSPIVIFAVIIGKTINRHQRLLLWSHGGFGAKKRSAILSLFDNLLLKLCDGVIFYTQRSHERLCDRIGQKQFIIVNNTVAAPNDFDPVSLIESILEKKGKASDKLKCVFVGGLNWSKRPKFLADIINEASRHMDFHVIGDGPALNYVKTTLNSQPNVTFHGHLEGVQKWSVLHDADLLLMPGMVGLASVDCMFMGIPTITTNLDIHSPEISYLQNGFNALIVKDDVKDFVAAFDMLLRDPDKLSMLKINCVRTVQNLSLDNMASAFVDFCLEELNESA